MHYAVVIIYLILIIDTEFFVKIDRIKSCRLAEIIYMIELCYIYMYMFISRDHHRLQDILSTDPSLSIPSSVTSSPTTTSSTPSTGGIDTLLAINAELLAQHEGNNLIGKKTGGIKPLIKCSTRIMQEKTSHLSKLVTRDGCVSISNILSTYIISDLISYINDNNNVNKNEILNNNIPFNDRYGGVNCRGIMNGIFGVRQDMFLPVYPMGKNEIVFKALRQSFQSLLPLLEELVTLDGMLHEISCIIANPG